MFGNWKKKTIQNRQNLMQSDRISLSVTTTKTTHNKTGMSMFKSVQREKTYMAQTAMSRALKRKYCATIRGWKSFLLKQCLVFAQANLNYYISCGLRGNSTGRIVRSAECLLAFHSLAASKSFVYKFPSKIFLIY